MSLINEALKRAKETHQQRPDGPPPGPPLRPAEHSRGRGGNLWLGGAFVVVLVAAAALLWQWSQEHRRLSQEIAAADATPAVSPEAPKPTSAAPAQSRPEPNPLSTKPFESQLTADQPKPALSAPAPPPTQPEAKPGPQVSAAPAAQPPPIAAASNAVVVEVPPIATAATAAPLVTADTPPKPVLRLQGILYNPPRSSAIINGKSLFLGDCIAEFRVLAIGSESVTLVGGGTTNVLSLE